MSVTYTAYIKNISGNILWANHNIVPSIVHKQNEISTATITCQMEDNLENVIYENNVLQIYREFPEFGISNYLEFEGIITDINSLELVEDRSTVTFLAQGWKSLLSRRHIMYQSSSYTIKAGAGETVIKAYVDENIGPTASNPTRLFNGVMQHFTIESDQSVGETWNGEDKAFQNLLSVVKDVSTATKISFDVIRNNDPNLTWSFIVKDKRIGEDKSILGISGNNTNRAGNIPVVFSMNLGNVSKITTSNKWSKKATLLVSTGSGAQGDQDIAWGISKSNDGTISYKEAVTSGGLSDTSSLWIEAKTQLSNLQKTKEVGIEIIQSPSSVYGTDYVVGDLITIITPIGTFNMLIESVSLSVDRSGKESIQVTLKEESVI